SRPIEKRATRVDRVRMPLGSRLHSRGSSGGTPAVPFTPKAAGALPENPGPRNLAPTGSLIRFAPPRGSVCFYPPLPVRVIIAGPLPPRKNPRRRVSFCGPAGSKGGSRCRRGPMAEIPPTRASLLVRLRDPQDQAAWTEFVDLYVPLIYNYARKQGLQDADA